MIQIAICDDEVQDLEHIAALIRKHLSSTAASIQTFSSSESFYIQLAFHPLIFFFLTSK